MARWNNLVHFGIFQFSRNFSTLFVFHFLEFFLFFHWTAQIFQSFCVFAPDFESLIGQAININLQKKFFLFLLFLLKFPIIFHRSSKLPHFSAARFSLTLQISHNKIHTTKVILSIHVSNTTVKQEIWKFCRTNCQ